MLFILRIKETAESRSSTCITTSTPLEKLWNQIIWSFTFVNRKKIRFTFRTYIVFSYICPLQCFFILRNNRTIKSRSSTFIITFAKSWKKSHLNGLVNTNIEWIIKFSYFLYLIWFIFTWHTLSIAVCLHPTQEEQPNLVSPRLSWRHFFI